MTSTTQPSSQSLKDNSGENDEEQTPNTSLSEVQLNQNLEEEIEEVGSFDITEFMASHGKKTRYAKILFPITGLTNEDIKKKLRFISRDISPDPIDVDISTRAIAFELEEGTEWEGILQVINNTKLFLTSEIALFETKVTMTEDAVPLFIPGVTSEVWNNIVCESAVSNPIIKELKEELDHKLKLGRIKVGYSEEEILETVCRIKHYERTNTVAIWVKKSCKQFLIDVTSSTTTIRLAAIGNSRRIGTTPDFLNSLKEEGIKLYFKCVDSSGSAIRLLLKELKVDQYITNLTAGYKDGEYRGYWFITLNNKEAGEELIRKFPKKEKAKYYFDKATVFDEVGKK